VARRRAYADWMGSAAWHRRREAWRDHWVATRGCEPACAVCGELWTLRAGDLHHRTYDRLGNERYGDVLPLCRPCHLRLHQVMESTPAWRRLGRRQATDLTVALLAAWHLRREEDDDDRHR